jgi:hypothetical protein
MTSVTKFLEQRLKLKVNRRKSAVGQVRERKYLGHRLLTGGELGVAPTEGYCNPPRSQKRLPTVRREIIFEHANVR